MLASILLNKPPEQITKDERQGVKPVSFGRPGGMGAERLQRLAHSSYGIELTMEEVQQRIEAYHRLCPELDAFLKDESDVGEVLAQSLGLTPAAYHEATGRGSRTTASEDDRPQPWFGWMLLKTLKQENPSTNNGREYTEEELDFFWGAASRLSLSLKPELQGKLKAHQADPRLWQAVRDQAGRRSVFTLTGRLRAAATFCSSRNCIFQGGSADGAILGMWKVWRTGYKLVDFVHDQVIVEVPEDDLVEQRRVEVAELMRQGMLEVIPGMNVKVDAVITRSLNKGEQVMIRPLAEGVGTTGPRLQEERSLLFSDLDVVRMCAAQ